MAATPGTPEYYHLPIAQRQADYAREQWAVATNGGNTMDVPIETYFSPQEATYFMAQRNASLTGWQAEVKEKFPNQAAYLSEPEIAQILKQAVDNKWSPEILQSNLESSVWWRSHNPSQRQWFLLNSTDPAGALQSVQQQFTALSDQAKLLGLILNAGQMMQLSIQTLAMGWTQQQETENLLKMAQGTPAGGTMGQTRDQLKGIAESYLIPVSDQSLDDWTRRVAAGTSTLDVFKDQMARAAMTRYQDHGIKDALQQGMTVKDFAAPYVAQAAQTLGLNTNAIDLLNNKWNQALDYVDPKTGHRRAMTLSEWDQHIKMDPIYGYDTSQNGIASAGQLVSQIREKFGVA